LSKKKDKDVAASQPHTAWDDDNPKLSGPNTRSPSRAEGDSPGPLKAKALSSASLRSDKGEHPHTAQQTHTPVQRQKSVRAIKWDAFSFEKIASNLAEKGFEPLVNKEHKVFRVKQYRRLWWNDMYEIWLMNFFDMQWSAIRIIPPPTVEAEHRRQPTWRLKRARSSQDIRAGGRSTERSQLLAGQYHVFNRKFCFNNAALRNEVVTKATQKLTMVICNTRTSECWACAEMPLDLTLELETLDLMKPENAEVRTRVPWLEMQLVDPMKQMENEMKAGHGVMTTSGGGGHSPIGSPRGSTKKRSIPHKSKSAKMTSVVPE